MQLTQEYFDKALKALATKEDLTKLATKDTLDRVAATVAGLVDNVGQLQSQVSTVKATLDSHTNILDGITKNTETWNAEAASLRAAIKRHDDWFLKIAEKLGMKLES